MKGHLVPPEPAVAEDPAHRRAGVTAPKCVADACTRLFSGSAVWVCMCVCVCLACLKFLKSPLLTARFLVLSVQHAGSGWVGMPMAKTFYIIKSFHSCYFWMLFSSCYSDPNAFCHRSDHMIVIFLLLPHWHVSRLSHIISTSSALKCYLFFSTCK